MVEEKLGIYVHIPFCVSKCSYCGFLSEEGTTEKQQEEYVLELIEDIIEYGKTYKKNYVVDTVFIGGGTPSLLKPDLIVKIINQLKLAFVMAETVEITIEANPKTLTRSKLLMYKEAGINRLSIGVQAFDDEILQKLGRIHNCSDGVQTYNLARECGFENVNIDLMFGVPGQNMEKWKKTLERVIQLNPDHVSFYSLQLEEGTPFFEMFEQGRLEQVSDEVDRQMYHYAIERLKKAGYEHYEISNCAKEACQCRHNLKYWSFQEYLGIGRGASSFIDGTRFAEAPLTEFHVNTFDDNISEYVFTGLRKTEGIDLGEFKERFGKEFWQVFADRKPGLATFFQGNSLVEKDGHLRLSEKGIDVSNKIMAEFV